MDSRTPRDGRALEELGTYDPMVPDVDARAVLLGERIDHWISKGALPTEKAGVLIKKYGSGGTHLEQQRAALEKLAGPKAIPDPGEATFKRKVEEPKAEEPEAEAPAAKTKTKAKGKAKTKAATDEAATPEVAEAPAEESAEAPAEETTEAPAEESTESPAQEAEGEAEKTE